MVILCEPTPYRWDEQKYPVMTEESDLHSLPPIAKHRVVAALWLYVCCESDSAPHNKSFNESLKITKVMSLHTFLPQTHNKICDCSWDIVNRYDERFAFCRCLNWHLMTHWPNADSHINHCYRLFVLNKRHINVYRLFIVLHLICIVILLGMLLLASSVERCLCQRIQVSR